MKRITKIGTDSNNNIDKVMLSDGQVLDLGIASFLIEAGLIEDATLKTLKNEKQYIEINSNKNSPNQ